jgi:hypothetical protein
MGYAELIQQWLQTLPQEKQAEIYDFVEFIASRSQTLDIPSEEQRKKQVLATLVAARCALAENLSLMTHNGADFKRITGLVVMDPFTA